MSSVDCVGCTWHRQGFHLKLNMEGLLQTRKRLSRLSCSVRCPTASLKCSVPVTLQPLLAGSSIYNRRDLKSNVEPLDINLKCPFLPVEALIPVLLRLTIRYNLSISSASSNQVRTQRMKGISDSVTRARSWRDLITPNELHHSICSTAIMVQMQHLK